MKEGKIQEIETPRLRLRMLTYDDLEPLARLHADPEIMRYMGTGKIHSRAETDDILDKMIRHWNEQSFGYWAVILKETNAFIGCAGLSFLDQTSDVQLDCYLSKRYWRKGLATEAAKACLDFGFQKLGLSRIVAISRPENIASERLLAKIGMNYEKDGTIQNIKVKYYALKKETYLEPH